jgi:hypothetical protein
MLRYEVVLLELNCDQDVQRRRDREHQVYSAINAMLATLC